MLLVGFCRQISSCFQDKIHPCCTVNGKTDSAMLAQWHMDEEPLVVSRAKEVYFKADCNHKFLWVQRKPRQSPKTKQTLRSKPNFVPNRMFRTAYGAWLMLSEPPHRTTSDSRRQISWNHTKKGLNYFLLQCHTSQKNLKYRTLESIPSVFTSGIF